MDLFKRNNGAVTVFLVIILVPCILVSCVFVDISRVMLAKNLSGSSADLSLNTAMTNYDPDLKKLYGLMASAQNMDEVYTRAGNYYQELLESQGLSKTEAINTSKTMVGMLKNEADASDLLRARVVDPKSAIVKPANADANLANATLLRNQIVDFMKYRGPIDIASNVYGLLENVYEYREAIKDSENDQKILDKKTDFFKAYGELIKELKELYGQLIKYELFGSSLFLDIRLSLVDDTYENTPTYRNKYKRIHHIFIKYALDRADVDFPGRDSFSSSEILMANDEIAKIQKEIEDGRKGVLVAEAALIEAKACYGKVERLLESCIKKQDAWQKAIDKRPNTAVAKENQEEISNLPQEVLEEVNLGLPKLRTKQKSIEKKVPVVGDALNAVAYSTCHKKNDYWVNDNLKKLKNIKSLSGYSDNIVTSFYSDLGVEDYSEEDFSVLIDPKNGTFYFVGADISSIANRDMTFEGQRLFDWLEEFFKDNGHTEEESEADKNAEKEMEEHKKQEEEKAENQENQDVQEGESKLGKNYSELSAFRDSFPTGQAGKNLSTNAVSGFVGLATNFAASDSLEIALVNMRDSLYATEYCKGMFSYYTLEREAKYREKPKGVTTEYDDILTLSSLGEFNKRNLSNNFAYRMELEYILYGNKNCAANVITAGANIFAVRMMLNTPSAFLNFYETAPKQKGATADAILRMAYGASAITRLPHQLFQAVFILALAATESGIDVKNLMEGHAVALYKKGEEDWVCSIKGGFGATEWKSKINGDANNKEANFDDGKVYLFYSDYLYLFLLMGFNSPSTGESQYLRVGDVIQANMRKTTDKSFLMSKATVYFKLETDIKVAPLMLALPIASNDVPSDINSWSYWTFHEKMTRGYQ